MSSPAITRILAIASLLLILSACATHRAVPRHFDAANPLKRVAALPMKNDTSDVDGPTVVRKRMIEALENKSYIVKDVKETDQILRDQMGINLGGQLDLTTAQKIGQVLGVEGVLYGTLVDFDETTTGVLNVRKVRAKFMLVDTNTGQPLWERGLGIRTETRMSGRSGSVAAAVARGADSSDKAIPWVTIDSVSLNERNVGQAFAIGMGAKLLTKAMGIHLEYESKELARRVTDNLPWGPGPDAAAMAAAPAAPSFTVPKMRMPEPPRFSYLDYGKHDFSAVMLSTSVDKSRKETVSFTIPVAKAGPRLRLDMDLTTMARGSEGMPPAISRVSTVHLGDRKVNYTLYPNAKKYMTHADSAQSVAADQPTIEKTRIGSEVVDGHHCDKYKVKITHNNGSVEEGYIWNARDLDGMTIKSEVENKDSRVTTELKKIVLKTPAASLFDIPAGYTEAQGFMDLMTETK